MLWAWAVKELGFGYLCMLATKAIQQLKLGVGLRQIQGQDFSLQARDRADDLCKASYQQQAYQSGNSSLGRANQ